MDMKKLITLIFLLISTWSLRSQSLSFDAMHKKLASLKDIEYSEKIYIHCDRTFYLTGETLWWKAYVLNGADHQKTGVTKIAYIEILDSGNTPVLQSKIEIINGLADGGLFIPASLNSGHYRLVAYTRWMQNAPADYFYSQNITIVNPFRKAQKSPSASNPLSLQFFPEGGNLVMGLPNEVAALGITADGKGMAYHGSIVNHLNDTVARFRSIQFGLSSFHFTPIAGETYRALAKADGKWSEFSLPIIEPRGITMQVESAQPLVSVTLHSLREEGNVYYLVLHHRTRIKLEKIVTIRSATEQFTIPYDSLGDGVNHLTVFSASQVPVAERLLFKRGKALSLEGAVEASKFEPRKKFTLRLKLPDGATRPAGFSMAVSKIDSLTEFEKTPIDTYLLLTSDLKGNIESPSYYFTNPNPEKDKLLDLVMKTHGWSRFDWREFLQGKSPKRFLPEYRGHIINGRISSPDGSPANGVVAYLAVPAKSIRIYPATSNKEGNFSVELKPFYGLRKMYLQTDFRKDSLFSITLQSAFANQHVSPILPAFSLNPRSANALIERSVSMQASSIYAKATPPPIDTDTTAFYGAADEAYRLDDYTRFPVLEEVLREYVAGIWVRKRGSNFSFQIPDKVNGRLLPGEPLVLLDGVPLFSVNSLMTADATRIKQIDVVERIYYLNGVSFNGIASFRSYEGDMAGITLNEKALVVDYDGLARKKEFYVPAYNSILEEESRIPDRRTLLIWKPNEEIEPSKGLDVSFFSSDLKGTFRIDIQGIDDEGHPISFEKLIEIK